MDTSAVARLRSSFELVAPRGQELIDTFYNRLFAAHPSVRGMFPPDMTKQKQHLLAAVGLVVKHADDLGSLDKPLMDMGARHVNYGVRPEHYPIVRDTMLAALAEIAGPAWTPQLAGDWGAALGAVAAKMIEGAESATRRAAA